MSGPARRPGEVEPTTKPGAPLTATRAATPTHTHTQAPHPRAPSHDVARLQRQVGNRVVASMLGGLHVQRLKEGDGPSNDVGVIQQQLNAVGAAPRLAITGRFDTQTTAGAKQFQTTLVAEKIAGVAVDGVVDGATHDELKKRAPSVKVSGTDTVVVGPGNTQVLADPAKGTHAMIKRGAKGIAVMELQERLNNAGQAAVKALVVDGAFGPMTDTATRQFQARKDVALSADGVVGPLTWGKLEKMGAASQGHVEFDWREEVEGVKNVGLTASYDWRLTKDALKISVGIDFRRKQPGVDAKIGTWLSDIKQIWSTFKAVNQTDPKKPSVDLDFEASDGGKLHKVDVFEFDPALAVAKRGESRSQSDKWYTIDPRRSMAPHEFGHLIGLADEYNRTEEHYLDVTGEEAPIGNPAGNPAQALVLATGIKAQLPLNDAPAAPIKAWNDERWGANLAAVITPALGRNQGGFSRLVAQQYSQQFPGSSVYTDIQKAFNDKKVPGFQANLSASVEPFLYSNKSLMGTMETTPAVGDGGAKAADHEHPIEPRHVRPFVDMLAREWTLQTGQADKWKPERR